MKTTSERLAELAIAYAQHRTAHPCGKTTELSRQFTTTKTPMSTWARTATATTQAKCMT